MRSITLEWYHYTHQDVITTPFNAEMDNAFRGTLCAINIRTATTDQTKRDVLNTVSQTHKSLPLIKQQMPLSFLNLCTNTQLLWFPQLAILTFFLEFNVFITFCIRYFHLFAECPEEAFQCNDGTCLSRGSVCNGIWECPDGSDEARCYKGSLSDRY